jgi:hypothetical protein
MYGRTSIATEGLVATIYCPYYNVTAMKANLFLFDRIYHFSGTANLNFIFTNETELSHREI